MKRKILAFALAVMMLVSVLPTSVFAADAHEHCALEGKTHTKENCPDAKQIGKPVAPICGKEGYTVYQCPDCEVYFLDDVLPAVGEHDYVLDETTAVAPTCEAKGNEAGEKCTVCGDVKPGKEIPALGKPGEKCDMVEVKREGDCSKGGSVWYECSKCGAEEKETFEKSEDGLHTWNPGAVAVITPPTAKEDGVALWQCKNCLITKEGIIVAICPHNLVKKEAAKSTQCGVEYLSVDCWYCAECDAYYIDDEAEHSDDVNRAEALAKKDVYNKNKAHTPGEVLEHVKPTCTENGYKKIICTTCKKEYIDNDDAEDKAHHELVVKQNTDSTCTVYGYKLEVCNICKYSVLTWKELAGHTAWKDAEKIFPALTLKVLMSNDLMLGNKAVDFELDAVAKEGFELSGSVTIGEDQIYLFTYKEGTLALIGEGAPAATLVKDDNDQGYSAILLGGVELIASYKTVKDFAVKSVEVTKIAPGGFEFVAPGEGTYTFRAPAALVAKMQGELPAKVQHYDCPMEYCTGDANCTCGYCLPFEMPADGKCPTCGGTTGIYDAAPPTVKKAAVSGDEITFSIDLKAGQKLTVTGIKSVAVNAGDKEKEELAITVDAYYRVYAELPEAPTYTAPTCEKDGSRVWTCICGKEMKEGAAEDEELAATGHETVTVWHMADELYGTYTFQYCTNANCDYKEVSTFTVKATEENGLKVDLAVPTLVDKDGNVVVIGKANRPAPVKVIPSSFTYVNNVDKDAHIWQIEEVIEPAGCETEGEAVYFCAYCALEKDITGADKEPVDVRKIDVIPALEHEYVKGEKVPVDCVKGEDGYTPWYCINDGCDTDLTDDVVTPAFIKKDIVKYEQPADGYYTLEQAQKQHNINEEFVELIPGTCGEGIRGYVCVDCGKMIKVYVGNPDGHKVPTAAQFENRYCTKKNCKDHTKETVGEDEFKLHGTYAANGWDAPAAGSCLTGAPSNTGDFYCDYCETKVEGKTEAIPHVLTKVTEVKATCTAAGNPAGLYCSVCKKYFKDNDGQPGDVIDTKPYEKKDHTLGDEPAYMQEANCLQNGGKNYFCVECQTFICEDYRAPYGHDWNDPRNEIAAGALDDGIVTRDELLNYTNPVKIARGPLDHLNPWYVMYYCAREGCEYHTGKAELSDKAYGHENEHGDFFFWDCTTEVEDNHCKHCCGLEHEIKPDGSYTCKNKENADHYSNIIFDDHGENEVKEYVEPTDEHDGYYVTVCSACGKIDTDNSGVIVREAGVEFVVNAENMNAPEGYKDTYADSSFVKVTVGIKNFLGEADIWGLNFFMEYDSKYVTLIEEGDLAPKFVSEAFGNTGVWKNNVPEENNKAGWTIAEVGMACNFSNADAAIDNNYTLNGELTLVELVFVVSHEQTNYAWWYITEAEVTNCDSEDISYRNGEAAEIEIVKFLDGNGDGAIDIKDVRMAYEIMKKTLVVEGETVEYNVALDTNKDGKIDLVDIRAIYEHITSRGENYLELVDRVPVVEEEPEA